MSRMIQIRNVPEEVHRQVKARAAMEGMTLSDFLLRELVRILELPPRSEIQRRIAALPPVELSPPPAEAIREERARR